MPHLFRFVLVAGGLLLTTAVTAQRRNVADAVLVPEAQVELALKGDDYLLGGVNLVAATNSGGSTFAAGQLRLGYEHFWSKQWSGGATLRVSAAGEGYGDVLGLVGNFIPGLLLRHTSKLGSFNFGQRLGVENAMTISGDGSSNPDRVLARLRLDLERLLPVSEKLILRPRLAYETAAYLRFQRDEDQPKERVLDFGSLRAELGLRVSPQIDFTPYMAWQTSYINALPQYMDDPNGNRVQTGGGRTNTVVPVVGLDLRFTLLPKQGVGNERRQLPTQH
ncbi:hypothetical protein [uncultured Hymenobacter sp.]|uniref:hypothetical protein n=1 Tax=uncultured Hymenobacter sp. TaxID=170016 RepID=UPI0035CBADF5